MDKRFTRHILVEMTGIVKAFSGVQVLHGIDLQVFAGEVHALIGENGAGKSTLMKILSGIYPATGGGVRFPGEGRDGTEGLASRAPHRISNDRHADQVVMIHQEFNLADDLTVEENIFLGNELRNGLWLDKRAMREKARAHLASLDTRIDPDRKVGDLSVAEKQMVEIAKALSKDARLFIMDEPTAVLTRSEIDVLFRLMRSLKARGVSIVYISHKLDEVKEISDRVTVLRDGRLITTRPTSELDEEEMSALMVGRDVRDMYPEKRDGGDNEDVVLSVRDVSVPGWVDSAGFDLRRGEILGFAGLVGAGRTELMEGVLGLRPRSSGRIFVGGREADVRSLVDAKALKIAYLTEDRKGKGLLGNMRLRPNLTLFSLERFARPLIDVKAESRALERAIEQFDIRVADRDAHVDKLSGGNQQKLALAKIMQVDPHVVILDEPTRGIDVGTKREMYHFIRQLSDRGKSCIVISSELPEIIGLCHRVVVMRTGRVAGLLEGDQLDEAEVMRYATGLKGAS